MSKGLTRICRIHGTSGVVFVVDEVPKYEETYTKLGMCHYFAKSG